MKTFHLQLYDTRQQQRIAGVRSFVGEDATGSFGILPGHARFMTILVFGMARFRLEDADWQYLAAPGGGALFP